MNDHNAVVQAFFSAYNSHDVDAMVALCADDARGRYVPYGRNSVVPIHGG